MSARAYSARSYRNSIVAGYPVDPYFSNVKLLLHLNGSNNSTSFPDGSSGGKTMTAGDNAKISTAQYKFGGSSLLVDGTTDRIYTASASADFVMGTGDFTVECWVYKTGGETYPRLLFFGSTGWNSNDSWGILAGTNGNANRVILTSYKMGASDLIMSSTNLSAAWTHVAVTRESGVFKLWINGVQEGSNSSYTGTATEDASTNHFAVGGSYTGSAGESMAGYVDDVRVTKGVARYTANFTPPIIAFPDL